MLLEDWSRFVAEALASGGSPAPSFGSSSDGSAVPDYPSPSAGLRGNARASYPGLSEPARAQEAVDEMVREIPLWGTVGGAHRLASLQHYVRALARWIAMNRFGSHDPRLTLMVSLACTSLYRAAVLAKPCC